MLGNGLDQVCAARAAMPDGNRELFVTIDSATLRPRTESSNRDGIVTLQRGRVC